ncbi:C-C motif chemokine 13-like isoform X2 [Protopterus annectens]|uniref:C-C motif chemokine 13-like isoform X2 n=1 Tax=Protopterus annectens TaxID=7888 RepID=UPI001CFC430A|nr:C-C motif chemokine 13-like isoform X2 [Protopterus annectens]
MTFAFIEELPFYTVNSTPSKCCFKFSSVRIPLQLIESYVHTSSECPNEAVIFVTKNGKEHCRFLTLDWVQNHIKNLRKN